MDTEQKQLDCSRLAGRMRSICEGTSGLPESKRLAYLQKWSAQGLLDPLPYGLGDFVKDCIDAVIPSALKPKNCGCKERQDWLNRLGKSALEWLQVKR